MWSHWHNSVSRTWWRPPVPRQPHSQVELLFRAADTIVFCFDGDKAGRKAAWRALEATLPKLKEGLQAKFLFLPDGEDPDSMVRKHGEAVFAQQIEAQVPCQSFSLITLPP